VKYFPIMGFSSIPWEMLAPHARQAMANHDQTLERLAERGGLDPYEAICILEDRKIVRGEARQLGDDNIKNDLRSKVADWNAINSQTAHAAVAIYAGIVALGEWARALRGRYKLEQEIEDAQDLTGDFKCLRRTDKPDPKFRLRQARKAAGKTINDLARHLGTSVVFVSDCEVGRATMPFDQLVETAHFLAVPLETIQ